jgi:hypothetical protein
MGVTLYSPVSGKDIGTKNGPDTESAESNDFGEPVQDKAEESGRFNLADFHANENGEITSCPMGNAASTRRNKAGTGHRASFDRAGCVACEKRGSCPVKVGKNKASIGYTKKTLRLAVRRAAQESREFKNKYRKRSGIEATNSQLAAKFKIKRLRVRGLKKVDAIIRLRVLGLNIWRAVRYKGRLRAVSGDKFINILNKIFILININKSPLLKGN